MKPSRSLSSAYPPALLLVFALMTLLACAHSGTALGSEERLQAQRVAFKKALPKAEAGDWNSVRPYLDLLQDYPLRPDLSAAWLRSSLGPETDAEVRRFLAGRAADADASQVVRFGALSALQRHGTAEARAAIVALATENMVQAIMDITVNQGIDPRKAVLIGGGGAAGASTFFSCVSKA